jgi:hypothetical protein
LPSLGFLTVHILRNHVPFLLAHRSFVYAEDNKFGGLTNQKVARAVAGLEFKVTSGEDLVEKASKVPGVGAGSAKKIDEFLETGKIEQLEEKRGSNKWPSWRCGIKKNDTYIIHNDIIITGINSCMR